MPYNTRRKSLSLSELGITVPKRSRTVSHPQPPTTLAEKKESNNAADDARPVKKSKRSHDSSSPPPSGLMSPPRTTTIRLKEQGPRRPTTHNPATLSPPPSPKTQANNKVDVEGISDDIVVATIQQLEKTGNRPHLVKELAHVLAPNLHSVEKSANPTALISSRLTAYLQRSWPTISPCPLAKDLSPVHPRRLYFFLTTTPRQPIPDVAAPLPAPHRIISPSLSSASAADEEEEENYNRRRTQLSPSPEVDLSSPELDDDPTQQSHTGSFDGRNSIARDSRSSSLSRHRAASPQLELEEQDFKQTASQLFEEAQQRRRSSQLQKEENSSSQSQDIKMEADVAPGAEQDSPADDADKDAIQQTTEAAGTAGVKTLGTDDRIDDHDAAALFFNGHADLLKTMTSMEFSSPVIRPEESHSLDETMEQSVTSQPREEQSQSPAESPRHEQPTDQIALDPPKLTTELSLPDAAISSEVFTWDGGLLQSPEHVDLAELEDMFDAY